MRRFKLARAAGVASIAVFLLLSVVGVTGVVVFSHASEDGLQKADAVIVLGGEHDGREEYGRRLVRDGYASVLVLSDPYPKSDPVMRRACDSARDEVEAICVRPNPLTTEGEAILTRRLAAERGWTKVIVVTWRYHLPRARFVFSKCLSWPSDKLVMRAVPREYRMSLGYWEYVYLYQYVAFAKAAISHHSQCA
jgi:uncharacterized SAM-binding protein YcdF (DUF218 family)